MAGTESTAAELQTSLDAFTPGTGSITWAQLKQHFEDLQASINIALKKSYFQALTGGLGVSPSFPTAFSAGSTYQLTWWAYDAHGNSVACTVTNMTITGFSVVAISDCTFHYVATKNN